MKKSHHKTIFIKLLMLIGFLYHHNDIRAQCLISGDSILCENESATYSTSTSGAVYQWNAYPGVAVGSGPTVNVNWGSSGTGVLTLVVKDAYGAVICSNTKSVDIYDKPTPIITPSFIAGCDNDPRKDQGKDGDPCLSVCDSTWVTYTVLDHPGSSYSWSISGTAITIPSTSNSFQVFWTGTGSGIVEVMETNAYGCQGKAELCVTVVEKPNASFTTLPSMVSGVTTACLGQEIIFQNTSNDGGGSPLWNYTWIWDDGNVTNLNAASSNGNTTHEYTSSGTYNVMLIVENECHCKDTFYSTVNITSDPAPSIYCISTVCPNTSVVYSTNDTGCTSYSWSAINGTITGGGTTPNVTISWDGTGPGYIGLTTSGCSPATCPTENIVEVPVITPSAVIHGEELVCYGSCEKYTISCTIPIDSIKWHFPPGVTVYQDSINLHEVEICYNGPSFDTGTIFVEYFHTAPGSVDNLSCGGTASLFVQQKPAINMSSSIEICDKASFGVYFNNSPSGSYINLNIANQSSFDTTLIIPTGSNFSSNWTWGPGTFILTLTDTLGNYCSSPEKRTIVVNEIPVPPLGIVGQDTICPNEAYEYAGIATSGEYSLQWSGTNGSNSISGTGPSYAMITEPSGPYILCLNQVDPFTGCKSESICDTLVPGFPLAAPIISGPDTVCSNGEQSYTATSTASEFEWTIYPTIAGSVISGQGSSSVNVEWNNWTGTASLVALATGCSGDTASTYYTVEVIGTPAPNMTIPPTICEGAIANMSSSTASATFTWDFGDGNTGSGGSTSHTYNTSGNMIVTLEATYTGFCTGTASTTGNIMVYPKPNVSISTPDPNIFCGTVGTVNMHVASPAVGTTYQWVYTSPYAYLGTGTSNSSNVQGNYYVIAENTYGCIDSSNVILIDSSCAQRCKPISTAAIDFKILRQGCNTDSFIGYNSAGSINMSYDFDDPFGFPSTAAGPNTSHTFPEPGYYRVEYCADVPNSTSTGYCRICTVKVDTVKYIADFMDSIYCSNGVDSLSVQMINTTKILSGMPTPSYAWSINFGGTISTSANPTFTLAPGTYTITLTVDGVCVQTKVITVEDFPVASFTSQDSICVNSPLFITNTSTGIDTSNILWTFGDAASSTILSPTRVYSTDGNFDISLIVGNAYGCFDSVQKTVTVLPNTLNALFTYPSISLCQGDSVPLADASSGGYPGYDWLWSTIESTPNIFAKYTGKYYFDLTDSKGCRATSNSLNILFNPTPKPQIYGEEIVCQYQTTTTYRVNYPASGYDFEWKKNGTIQTGWVSNYYSMDYALGNHVITVTVTSDSGCIGYDTFKVKVVPRPNVSILSASGLCEGETHLLVGNSTSTNLVGSYWSNGEVKDSIYVSTPSQYTYTVVDSFGCTNSSSRVVHPLPEFCGLMTGCYEFCDTISELVWFAPKGYASYQWLYNGVPITGANSDTLHIPLYTAGTYNLVLMTYNGCIDTSKNIDIEFTDCNKCKTEVKYKVECGPVNSAGQQTYNVTLQVNNTFGPGAILNLSSPAGIFSGTTPTVLPLGWSTVTTTFTDVAPINSVVCVDLYLSYNMERCKTDFCFELPDCDKDCDLKIQKERIECVGFDASGNPMYQLCADVVWGGSNGSTLTMTTSSGSFSPNPVTINNGFNSLCFTYTDLPPHSNVTVFTFNVFDPIQQANCKESIKLEHKPCEDSCTFGVYGICAHCKDKTDEGWLYNISLTVDNTLGSGATLSVLPISGGVFGTISPNPIPYGVQSISLPFTDIPTRDSVICFRILMELQGKKCWQDICVFLPDCEKVGIDELSITYFTIAPNPANDKVTLRHNSSGSTKNILHVFDAVGKKVKEINLTNLNTESTIDVSDLDNGVYILSLTSDGQARGNMKLVIQR